MNPFKRDVTQIFLEYEGNIYYLETENVNTELRWTLNKN